MPLQNRGQSKQNYRTPPELLEAVKERLGITRFGLDVASDHENAVADMHYTEEDDGLAQSWATGGGWAWCNPPYANINPWVLKAATEAHKGNNSILLVPASVGANWWKEWVVKYAFQTFLNGRITFVDCIDPYPKDCALLLYTPWRFTGNNIWTWQ